MKKYNNNNNKFHSLNFNLKNEILDFLPLESLFEQASIINKSFKYAFNNCGYIKILTKKFNELSKQIEINTQSIEKIKSEFLDLKLANEKLNEICAFLLLRKELMFGNYLKLSENRGFDFEVLLELIKSKNIKSFHFSINNIGDCEERLNLLCKKLLGNKSIEKLSLKRSNIGKAKKSFKSFFFDFFAENLSLKFLDLGINCIGLCEQNMQVFCEAIGKNNSILELDFSLNSLSENFNNLRFFADFFLAKNDHLQVLNLDNNSIGSFESDMQYLAEGLIFNSALKKIKLNCNRIGHNLKDVFWLCEVFRNNKTLNYVYLSGNWIGGREEDIENLCAALRENEGLIHVDLEKNSIEDANEFLEKLAKEKTRLEIKWKNEFFDYSFL